MRNEANIMRGEHLGIEFTIWGNKNYRIYKEKGRIETRTNLHILKTK